MWYIAAQSDTPRPGKGPRDRLLVAALEYALEQGIAGVSLRQLAAALGTSHRMLIHHFGSKEELLVAVIRAAEERQRSVMAEHFDQPDATPAEAGWRHWRELSDPAFAPQERLFFEVYVQALRGRTWALPMLDGVVEDWVADTSAHLQESGLPEAAARPAARLGLAVTRGLLLDLLATGDRAGVDAAMELFFSLFAALEAGAPSAPNPPNPPNPPST
ncbi:MAG: TetR/AcrR family transcriptional regulator [Actinomycetota bacterium]|nr:TetR/AcrR family transcriptional regulator [Actinomycetota bacterium]